MIITGRRSVGGLLEHRNESTPDSIFLIWEDRSITYRTLNDQVNRLADGLLELGVGQGDRVMIHLSNCPEFIYFFFALLKIGAIAVLSNINNLLEELSYTLSQSTSSFVITATEYSELMKKAQGQIPTLKGIILTDGEEVFPEAISMRRILAHCPPAPKRIEVSAEDDASILYTSGTSGKPKGVLYTHGNLVFAGEVFSKQIRLAPNDRHLGIVPLFHNNALNHQLLPVVTTGASMVLFKKFSSSKFGDQIRQYNVTVVTLASPLLRFILNTPEKPNEDQNSLRVICSGANQLSPEEVAGFTRRFKVPITNFFGQTESVVCPLHSPLDGKRKEGAIGLPTLGYEVRIANENDEEVPEGQVGEILVRGLGQYSLMKGYYKDPEATAVALKNGWLHTGDLGFMDEEGYFYFVGRKKEMIKVGGRTWLRRKWKWY